MRAPTTHDPLVVNTKDGVTWLRRAVTSDGRGLYAVTDSCKCPPYLMATLAELAEHGIAGSADVLPVPVGPESPVDADRANAPWGRGEDGRPLLPMGAHWTDVPELVDQEVARIRGRVDQAQSGRWYVASDTETWRAPGTVRTNVDGYQRTVGRVTAMLPADLDLVLHAHDDVSWCLEMIAKFRSQVAALLAERHSTNESLDDAVQATVPDFFQPGRTYLRFVGDREFYFRVTSISTDNPNQSDSLAGDGPVAYGWSRTERSTTVWGPTGQTSFVGWHDVTEAGAS